MANTPGMPAEQMPEAEAAELQYTISVNVYADGTIGVMTDGADEVKTNSIADAVKAVMQLYSSNPTGAESAEQSAYDEAAGQSATAGKSAAGGSVKPAMMY